MHMIVEYEGKVYRTKETDEVAVAEAVDRLWPHMDDLDKFKMELDDGSVLLLGKEACRRAVFLVVPNAVLSDRAPQSTD